MQYLVNQTGKRISVVIPIAEYEALLQATATEDETMFLLREPNGSILPQRVKNINQGCNLIEKELLPDEV